MNFLRPLPTMLFFSLMALLPVAHGDDSGVEDWNGLAHVLAGSMTDSSSFASTVRTASWKKHAAFMDTHWSKMRKTRLKVAEEWRDKHLTPTGVAAKTLLYPFSGPDFLNAYLFFPSAERYVFFGLEDPGTLPAWSSMTEEQRADLLHDIRVSLSDLFKRHYFITKKMMSQLRTPYLKGNLAVFLVFLSRMGCDVTGVEPIQINADATIGPRDTAAAIIDPKKKAVPGIRLCFTRPGAPPQELLYFALDVSNKGLEKHEQFLPYLRSLAPIMMFTKAASYLLHGSYFTWLRRVLVEITDYLVQDDSGMPYRFLKKGEWEIHLYGRYAHPTKDFGWGYQKNLDEAYQSPNAAHPLPFRFGYHWWDGYSNMIVAARKHRTVNP